VTVRIRAPHTIRFPASIQDTHELRKDGNIKIPEAVRNACYARFSTIPHFDVPDICGVMEHTRIYIPAPAGSHTASAAELKAAFRIRDNHADRIRHHRRLLVDCHLGPL